jgi:NADH dehydrogenase (ubiquinone) 1 alpha subcomplex subunit 9
MLFVSKSSSLVKNAGAAILKNKSAVASISTTASNKSALSRNSDSNVTQYGRGTGGRASFNGNCVTIFGATGMIGRILANRLGKEGSQLIVPFRGDPWDARSLKLVGDLGQVLFQEVDIRDPERMRKAIQHSNIVINAMGADYETRNFSFEDVHVNGARMIARLARECRVERLIHFSALNASPDPQKIYFKPSQFLVAKWNGEQAVKEEFDDAVIIRPANVYGESDRFLYYYANQLRREGSALPLWNKGEMTIKMPVHQMDLADGIMKIIRDKDIKGVTYDFVGPESFLLSEITDYINHLLRNENVKRTLMTPTRLAITYMFEKVWKRPPFTLDLLEREFISDSLSTDAKNPTLRDLGIQFRRFDESVAWNLKVYNKLSYYDAKVGELEATRPPKPLSEDFEYQLRRKIRQTGSIFAL